MGGKRPEFKVPRQDLEEFSHLFSFSLGEEL